MPYSDQINNISNILSCRWLVISVYPVFVCVLNKDFST